MTGADLAARAHAPEGGERALETTETDLHLPEPVRQRVVMLAAGALSKLAADEVPMALRKIARFAPGRRARLRGPLLAAHVAADPRFRSRIAEKVLEEAGDLGEALIGG